MIGGTSGDDITAGGDHDVVFGDHAEIDYSRPVDRNVISRFMRNADGGGDDTIHGNLGDDFLFGGQGGDNIEGNEGQDDIVGGHNVVFGDDGDDHIDGGDAEDVILGDNGVIKRNLLSTELGTWETYLAPFETVVIRDPQPFDDQDLIEGDDTLLGGSGMDILRGQRGADEIRGGDDSDEIIGGLGADNLFGDAGQDFILADAGQILRDFNDDGTPQLNRDGTWHRDLITESIGRVMDIIPMDPAGLINLPSDLADRLLAADHIVMGGISLPSGTPSVDFVSGQWQTVALLIDNVGVDGTTDDDTVDGGSGEDVILGQSGDDDLRGGADNDTLIGDHGINTVNFETDLPQMLAGYRLIGVDSGADTLSGIDLALPAFGQLFVPDLVATPGALVAEAPRWDQVSPVNEALATIANDDDLQTSDDLRITPSLVMVPTFVDHTEVLHGNDTLRGEAGDDLLFGDELLVVSELQTGLTPIENSLQRANATVAAAMQAFEGLVLDHETHRVEVLSGTITDATMRVGSDSLYGGDDDDTLVGDQAIHRLPPTRVLPAGTTSTESASSLQGFFSSLELIGDDATQLVATAHLNVVELLVADAEAARPSLPAITSSNANYVQHRQLVFGQDTLDGDAGIDTLLGDRGQFIAPLTTGTEGDLPQSALADGITPSEVQGIVDSLDAQALAFRIELDERREARSVNVVEALGLMTPLNRIAYVPSWDRQLSKDTIKGGDDADLIGGGDVVVASPLIQTTPTNATELLELDRHVEAILDQIAEADRGRVPSSFTDHMARVQLRESVTDQLLPSARIGAIEATWSIDEDTIEGGDDNDSITGDHFAFVTPVLLNDPTQHLVLSRSDYGIGFLEDSMGLFLDNDVLGRVNVGLSKDVIHGEHGNDTLLGSVGDDTITGGDGDDTLRGGNQRDDLDGGSGTNVIRSDGGNYPNTTLRESLGSLRFDSTSAITTNLFLDAATNASAPSNWTTPGGTGTTSDETGDPDPVAPPVPRTVTLSRPDVTITDPTNAVIGQSIVFESFITDSPGGAVQRFLWEVTDFDGNVVAAATGATFIFTPPSEGTYQVKVVGEDTDNGQGEAMVDVQAFAQRLIADSANPGKFILMLGGTEMTDDIRLNDVRRQPESVEVRQRSMGTWVRTVYDNISRIDVYAGEGDDDISGDRQLVIPLRLFGGPGDDKLRGGAGNDYLHGGAGDDRVLGQRGEDVMIGGLGSDRVDGGRGDDLIITEDLTAVPGTTDVDSLMSRWSNSSDSVADRVTDLIGDLTSAIEFDGVIDRASGGGGSEWFFAQLSDEIRQRRNNTDVKTLF